ncbi:hypothetical protein RJZ56_004034 [Blastomyces dermatitidis]
MRNQNGREIWPAWPQGLHALIVKEDRDLNPEDFNEDLSSLSDLAGSSNAEDNKDKVNRDDTMSDRSYTGSDASFYYELKAECQERKMELQEIGEHNKQAKDNQQTFDRDREREVQEMYDPVKKQSKTPLEPITGHFCLYSVEHIDYCYSSDMYSSKYVEFYYLDEDDHSGQLLSPQ